MKIKMGVAWERGWRLSVILDLYMFEMYIVYIVRREREREREREFVLKIFTFLSSFSDSSKLLRWILV